MAEEILVKEQLNWWQVEAGLALTKQLRQTDFGLACSFWLYSSDSNEWKLVLASRLVDREGPLKGYEFVQNVFSELWSADEPRPLEIYGVSVLRTDAQLIGAIRSLGHFEIEEPPSGPKSRIVFPMESSRPTPRLLLLKPLKMANIDGVFIEEAFIYFIV